MTEVEAVRRPNHRYRNQFRWRVMPPEQAAEAGFFDQSFSDKNKAVEYQKRVKARFPEHPCCLCDTGRYFDALGHSYDRKE